MFPNSHGIILPSFLKYVIELDECHLWLQERVLKCYGVMQEEILISSSTLKYGMPSVPSMPQSPIGVLDAACLSYKSNEMISESQPSSHHSSPAAKRRKLSRASIS